VVFADASDAPQAALSSFVLGAHIVCDNDQQGRLSPDQGRIAVKIASDVARQ
jgi:hypothetical protein